MNRHTASKILAGQNVTARAGRGGGIISGAVWGVILTSSVFGTLEARRAIRESYRLDAKAIEVDLAVAGRWAQSGQIYFEKAVDPGRCILYAPDNSTFPAGVGSFLLAPGCSPAESARERGAL